MKIKSDRPSNKHPDCRCGRDQEGRWVTDCTYHTELNERLNAMKDTRPWAERVAEARANVEAWHRNHGGGSK